MRDKRTDQPDISELVTTPEAFPIDAPLPGATVRGSAASRPSWARKGGIVAVTQEHRDHDPAKVGQALDAAMKPLVTFQTGSIPPPSQARGKRPSGAQRRKAVPKKPGPPPSVYTDEVVAKICSYIENTIPTKHAVRLAGLNPVNFESCMRERPDVYEKVEAARSRSAANLVAMLHKDANEGRNINRSTWLLERLHPKDFFMPSVIQHQGPNGGPVQTMDVSQAKPRWALDFMVEHGRWPNADEKPEGVE